VGESSGYREVPQGRSSRFRLAQRPEHVEETYPPEAGQGWVPIVIMPSERTQFIGGCAHSRIRLEFPVC
jgi:hypothetical protein